MRCRLANGWSWDLAFFVASAMVEGRALSQVSATGASFLPTPRGHRWGYRSAWSGPVLPDPLGNDLGAHLPRFNSQLNCDHRIAETWALGL